MSFTSGATGGEYKHTLTIKELASHNHPAKNFLVNSANGNQINVGSGTQKVSYWTNNTLTTDNLNGDEPHNNIQPYTVIYRWRRTA